MNYPRFLLSIIAVGAALFEAPVALGVGWSVVGVPLYGLACGDWHGIINGSISADGYRIFLTNRGCKLKDEIKKIVAKDYPDDLPRLNDLIAMVTGKTQPSFGDDVRISSIRKQLREPRPIALCGHLNRENPDAPGGPAAAANGTEAGCSQPRWHSDDLMGRFSSYLGALAGTYLSDGFVEGLNWGADTLAGLAATGPVVRALLAAVCAMIVALPFGSIALLLMRWLRGTSISRPQGNQ